MTLVPELSGVTHPNKQTDILKIALTLLCDLPLGLVDPSAAEVVGAMMVVVDSLKGSRDCVFMSSQEIRIHPHTRAH
jgi:hypothetical protein